MAQFIDTIISASLVSASLVSAVMLIGVLVSAAYEKWSERKAK